MRMILSILVIAGSTAMLVYAREVAKSLEVFWKEYPLLRRFHDNQFRLRPVYVRVVALILLVIGIIALLPKG